MRQHGTAILSAAVLGAIAHVASAAVIDFEGGTELADNFRPLTTATPPIQTANGAAGNDYILQDNVSTDATVIVYDTTPLDATPETANTFTGNFSIQFDISAAQAGSSFGVMLANPASEESNTGLLALFNVDVNQTNDTIRFFRFSTLSTGKAGTQVGSTVSGPAMDLSTDASPTWTTLKLDYSVVDGAPQLEMTVGALTATSTYTASELITEPELAIRIYDPKTDSGTARVDNLSISVPEPAALGLLGGSVIALMARRRRA